MTYDDLLQYVRNTLGVVEGGTTLHALLHTLDFIEPHPRAIKTEILLRFLATYIEGMKVPVAVVKH